MTEDEVAWDLLADHRGCLTVAERHSVSINLAVGEYRSAIQEVLAAVVREGDVLAAESATNLRELIGAYEYGADLGTLFDSVSRRQY
ncbi:hypothetical protein NIIDNTM18_51860 [Mycolicibacterium litorale]|uniref:Uncharacterized protein n=1 Tax=Mycolicibacterium litorale TaxID=758802 RepID=A0A6S6PIX1_9MYCO|nr:hypothetical protein [Mycolicibacterium litorale]BCI55908.1 hypothetical protein NIIDNTM18_51860 [Mycolicibacterium litorale]